MGIKMRLFLLTATLLLVQLSQQAAVPAATDASELAFPDGEAKDYEEYVYGIPYYLCKCSFEEYEDYWGEASVDTADDTADHAWCPCFQYDYFEHDGVKYEYATRRTRRRTGAWTGRRSITPGGV